MVTIDWDHYKEYKSQRKDPHGYDNFMLLLEFIRSFYNKQGVFEVYEMLSEDELAIMMLEKRGISDPESLETYILKNRR